RAAPAARSYPASESRQEATASSRTRGESWPIQTASHDRGKMTHRATVAGRDRLGASPARSQPAATSSSEPKNPQSTLPAGGGSRERGAQARASQGRL